MVSPPTRSSYPDRMNTFQDSNTNRFDNPGIYQILVQGRVSASWADRFDGMRVTINEEGNAPPTTTLYGRLPDQAALAGVLNTLYELHLSVLAVMRVDE
jgi:hypothetical protein